MYERKTERHDRETERRDIAHRESSTVQGCGGRLDRYPVGS